MSNLISVISIFVGIFNILYTIWIHHKKIKFFTFPNYDNFYISFKDLGYYDRHSLGFVLYYFNIENYSASSCVINRALISATGYSTISSDSTPKTDHIRRFIVESESNDISNEDFLKLPLSIPAYGSAQGYLLFPCKTPFNEDSIKVEITLYANQKRFQNLGIINHRTTIPS